MKYVIAALIATASAQNPNYIIDGATAERAQGQVLNATRDAAHFVENDLGPNFETWWNDQGATEREFAQAAQHFENESAQNWRNFENRAHAGNYDQKIENIARQIDDALAGLDQNARSNGYYFRRQARAQTNLWSVGMTSTKTAAVNAKLQKVAQDAMALGNDPVYGPFIQQHQEILMNDIEVALNKYSAVMEAKYNSDPAFKAKVDAYIVSSSALGEELDN